MAINVATLPVTVGVGGFLRRGPDLLVVRKTYGPWAGLWTIPSGYVEPRESVVQTIEREVLEEAGIVGRVEALVGVRNLVAPRVNDTFLVFTMVYVSGEPKPDGIEVSEAAFVPMPRLAISPDSAPFTKAIVAKVPGAKGMRLDPYMPPAGTLDHEAYLLYL